MVIVLIEMTCNFIAFIFIPLKSSCQRMCKATVDRRTLYCFNSGSLISLNMVVRSLKVAPGVSPSDVFNNGSGPNAESVDGDLAEVLAGDRIEDPQLVSEALQLIVRAEINRRIDEVRGNLRGALASLVWTDQTDVIKDFSALLEGCLDQLQAQLLASPIQLNLDGNTAELVLTDYCDIERALHLLNSLATLVERADVVVKDSADSLANLKDDLVAAKLTIEESASRITALDAERSEASKGRLSEIADEQRVLREAVKRARTLTDKKGGDKLKRKEKTHQGREKDLLSVFESLKSDQSEHLVAVVRSLIAFVKRNQSNGSTLSKAEVAALLNVPEGQRMFDLEVLLMEIADQPEPILEVISGEGGERAETTGLLATFRSLPRAVQLLVIVALLGLGLVVLKKGSEESAKNDRPSALVSAGSRDISRPEVVKGNLNSFEYQVRQFNPDEENYLNPDQLKARIDRGIALVADRIGASSVVGENLKAHVKLNRALYDYKTTWAVQSGLSYNSLESGKAGRYWFAVADASHPVVRRRPTPLLPDYNAKIAVVQVTPFDLSEEWAGIVALSGMDNLYHVGLHNPKIGNEHFHRKLEMDQSVKTGEYADAFLNGGLLGVVDNLLKREKFESTDDVLAFIRKGDFKPFADEVDDLPGNVPIESESERLTRWGIYARVLVYRFIEFQNLGYEAEVDERMWALEYMSRPNSTRDSVGKLRRNSLYSFHADRTGGMNVIRARDELRSICLAGMQGSAARVLAEPGSIREIILPTAGFVAGSMFVLERERIGDAEDSAIFHYTVYFRANGFDEISGIYTFESEIPVRRIP